MQEFPELNLCIEQLINEDDEIWYEASGKLERSICVFKLRSVMDALYPGLEEHVTFFYDYEIINLHYCYKHYFDNNSLSILTTGLFRLCYFKNLIDLRYVIHELKTNVHNIS
jgi:hypothetical protein